jgi:uncharacterized protein (DUF2062 family)
MARKFFRRFVPDHEEIRNRPVVRAFGSLLQHPNLWHLNRDSVSRAVAIGLFGGLVPGPFQMLTVVVLAIPLHCNLPVGLLVTLYTNPFTIVPLYLVAYQYGQLLLGGDGSLHAIEPFAMDWGDLGGSLRAALDWTLSLGKPLAVGLVALAHTLAAAGYALTQLAWRAYVVLAWRRRRKRRTARAS